MGGPVVGEVDHCAGCGIRHGDGYGGSERLTGRAYDRSRCLGESVEEAVDAELRLGTNINFSVGHGGDGEFDGCAGIVSS